MQTKFTLAEIIIRFKKVHQDKYDYSLVKYVKTTTKVIIICRVHGVFEQTPHSHISGRGCSKCGNVRTISYTKLSGVEFINKAKQIHQDSNGLPKYNYSKVNYIKSSIKIIIVCPIHGKFKQTPNNHLRSHGCAKCSNNIKKSTTEVIKNFNTVHSYRYDYSKVNYKNNKIKVTIICPHHGEFQQSPACHLRGHGCGNCFKKNESMTGEILKRIFPNLRIYCQKKIDRFRVDFFFEKDNKEYIVEYNGEQHYQPIRFFGFKSKIKANANFIKQQQRDQALRNYCKNNNIVLIEIDGRKYQGFKIKDYLNYMFTKT